MLIDRSIMMNEMAMPATAIPDPGAFSRVDFLPHIRFAAKLSNIILEKIYLDYAVRWFCPDKLLALPKAL